ncbi:aspartate aminotransferase family protein [Sphingosinicella sp.]|uniref:aminotransferase family protein n=1 Tax=Sphingosinicella sp. TaxID=1917971 RepID=UPI0035AEB2E8
MDLRERALDKIWFHVTPPAALRSPGGMMVFERGEGCYLTEVGGDVYLDALSGGAFVTNVGHGRKEIADAMAEQAAKLAYVTPYNFAAEPTVKLAEKIAEITPGDLSRVFFTSGGSEAVETALKIAKQYHWLGGDQKRTKVISRHGSYHGSTHYAMSITGASHDFNSKIFAPLVPGTLQAPHHNCYRCELEQTYPACRIQCARTMEKIILHEGPDTIAAIIAEPIPSAASIYLPPDEYLPVLREICDKYGILLILDEVINGFGRTGKMFASEHWGVTPDIMTMAKGLTSGYAPMGATVTSPRVTSRFEAAGGRESGLNHVISFGGHAASAAGALKNIEIMENEGMIENSRVMGDYLLEGLKDVQKRSPIIGDVRGKGLLAAVELVRDKKTGQPFAPSDMLSAKFTAKMREEGVLMRTFAVAEFGPPLCAGRREVEKIVEALEKSAAWFASEAGVA